MINNIAEIKTRETLIADVLHRWKKQYSSSETFSWMNGITDKTAQLEALYAERTPTKEAIDEIIGNDSWTVLRCDNCDRDVEKVCIMERYENYLQVCSACLRMCVSIMENK